MPPEPLVRTIDSTPAIQSHFAAENGAVTLHLFNLSEDIYAGTNFEGGVIGIFVNPRITNPQSCAQFGIFQPQFLTSRSMGGIVYAELRSFEGGMGHVDDHYYFHTFQNGLCYEMAFEFDAYNTYNHPLGCRVPSLGVNDEAKVIQEFAGRIAFFRPAKILAAESNLPPVVTSFTAASHVANDGNRWRIQFSWTARDADYVEFSYTCPPTSDRLVISEDIGMGHCENDKPAPDSLLLNHSPNSSSAIGFGFFGGHPVPVVVTITPFSHAVPYPQSGKSLTITVDPLRVR